MNRTCSRCGAVGPPEDFRECWTCRKKVICKLCYLTDSAPSCADCDPETARLVKREIAALTIIEQDRP